MDGGIPRQGAGGYIPAVWEEALKKETKGFAETIHYMIGEGCTTGVAQNLSAIERFYLRSKQPCRVPFLSPIAQVVSQLKLDRIAEVGKNPNSGSYVERITAMAS